MSERNRERWAGPKFWLVLFVLGACALGVTTPAAAKARSGPDGRQLYLEHCARCHGADRRGDGPDAPFFVPAPRDLSTGFLEKYEVEDLVVRVREGVPLSLGADPEGRAARAKKVEAIVAHLEKLPDVDWASVDAGGEVFGERCEACHGAFGRPWSAGDLPDGVQTAPRDLRQPVFQRSLSDAELAKAVRHGVRGMPAMVPALSDEQAEHLVSFVRILSPGFEIYSFYCAGCHGDDGRGRGILLRDDEEVDVVFDRPYLSGKDPDALRAAVWHMMDQGGGGMPHLEHSLDADTVRQIVKYLQGAPPHEPQ